MKYNIRLDEAYKAVFIFDEEADAYIYAGTYAQFCLDDDSNAEQKIDKIIASLQFEAEDGQGF